MGRADRGAHAQTSGKSIKALDRDYKRVHEDVTTLEADGMIVREGSRLSAPWDAVRTEVTL
jgi:predicted transcriptional regulator